MPNPRRRLPPWGWRRELDVFDRNVLARSRGETRASPRFRASARGRRDRSPRRSESGPPHGWRAPSFVARTVYLFPRDDAVERERAVGGGALSAAALANHGEQSAVRGAGGYDGVRERLSRPRRPRAPRSGRPVGGRGVDLRTCGSSPARKRLRHDAVEARARLHSARSRRRPRSRRHNPGSGTYRPRRS